jgi:hypothetical protein
LGFRFVDSAECVAIEEKFSSCLSGKYFTCELCDLNSHSVNGGCEASGSSNSQIKSRIGEISVSSPLTTSGVDKKQNATPIDNEGLGNNSKQSETIDLIPQPIDSERKLNQLAATEGDNVNTTTKNPTATIAPQIESVASPTQTKTNAPDAQIDTTSLGDQTNVHVITPNLKHIQPASITSSHTTTSGSNHHTSPSLPTNHKPSPEHTTLTEFHAHPSHGSSGKHESNTSTDHTTSNTKVPKSAFRVVIGCLASLLAILI